MKKRLVLIILIVIFLIGAIFITNSKKCSERKIEKRISKICKHNDKIINMDIEPNAIVARVNGQEILKCEVDLRNHAIENAKNLDAVAEQKNALYEIILGKLLIQKYYEPDKELYSEFISRETKEIQDIDVDELNRFYEIYGIQESEKWLTETEFKNFIIQGLVESYKKSRVNVIDIALKNTKEIKNKNLETYIKEYNKSQEDLKSGNNVDDMYDKFFRLKEQYEKIIVTLANVELYEKNFELSDTKPEEYIRENS